MKCPVSVIRRIISLLPWLAGVALLPAGAAEIQMRSLVVTVVGVSDGDTVTVVDSNRLQYRVRLAGIDAPERRQPFSERSRQNLASLVHRKTVRLEWKKVDQYGRLLARVLLDPAPQCAAACEPVDINLQQLRTGLAWHYRQYQGEQAPADRESYAQAEKTARSAHSGLWQDPQPVAPWDWRRASRSQPPRPDQPSGPTR